MRLAALAANPLLTRSEAQQALRDLVVPLRPHVSPGQARVRLGVTGAHFADAAAELEGFARPLWGLAPLAQGGASDPELWACLTTGVRHGVNPAHDEYWGQAADRNQRLVEMAAIGFALASVPERIWSPLDGPSRAHLTGWLRQIAHHQVSDNNWHFFRVMVALGLMRVDQDFDGDCLAASLARLEDFYMEDGWYNDGPPPCLQVDYYVPFAFHFYGLIYADLAGSRDPVRAGRYRQRATLFARHASHWFSAEGAGLPFGRSLTYRFAQAAFWGALAYADVEALPWGIIRGLWARNLRWWFQRPIGNPDGTLSIGYAYPNLNMAEDYNSPGSPYWALKAFLPLALPDGHPFWTVAEEDLPAADPVVVQAPAHLIICRQGTHHFALSLGQSAHQPALRHAEAKYGKFAYSTTFGFSVPAGQRGLSQGAYDSTLALSDDGIHYRPLETPLEARVDGQRLIARWRPFADVEVETTLEPAETGYRRRHRLRTGRALWSAEGGWALDRTGDDPATDQGQIETGPGLARARYPAGWSAIRDLGGTRSGEVVRLSANTNVLHPRTALPTLVGQHPPGEHEFICLVDGRPA